MAETDIISAAQRPLRDVFTVSRLNREVRAVLEGSFPLLWIEGEVSNLARPASGHLYFSLKDEAAQVRCAMFRNRKLHLPFAPENGMHVLLRARVGFSEPRGEIQLIVTHLEEAGTDAPLAQSQPRATSHVPPASRTEHKVRTARPDQRAHTRHSS